MTTKEAILEKALELFSERGFDSVSVRDISSELGLSEAAMYRHYRGKDALLDAIVRKAEEDDRRKAIENGLPEDIDGSAVSAEAFLSFSSSIFRYWTEDCFAIRFRRLLTIEQYSNPMLGMLYENYLSSGPLGYTEYCLKKLGAEDAESAALSFYASLRLLMDLSDHGMGKEEIGIRLDATIREIKERIHGIHKKQEV